MSGRPQWAYVQARLQARHGERLQESDWQALEAAKSADHYTERSRATSLRRFTDRLNARMDSHAIERALRASWRAYIAEVAAWMPAAWRQAVLWTSLAPDLPTIDALFQRGTPEWVLRDPALAELAETQRRNASLAASAIDPLLSSNASGQTVAERWFTHWRSLWPPHPSDNRRALLALSAVVRAHVARLAEAGPQDTSMTHRRDLARNVTRMFRRHGGSPTAVFCHLVLVALDLERLRGDLVRRRVFAPSHVTEAA